MTAHLPFRSSGVTLVVNRPAPRIAALINNKLLINAGLDATRGRDVGDSPESPDQLGAITAPKSKC